MANRLKAAGCIVLEVYCAYSYSGEEYDNESNEVFPKETVFGKLNSSRFVVA